MINNKENILYKTNNQIFVKASKLKIQRKTKNLGYNTIKTQDESYNMIETKNNTAKCSSKEHEGERMLPIRNFYLNKNGKSLQASCIECQKKI